MKWQTKLGVSLGMIGVVAGLTFLGFKMLPYPSDSATNINQQLQQNSRKKDEVLIFYRPGCGDCARVKSTVLTTNWRIKWVTQSAEIGFVNTDKQQNRALLKRFSVTSVPTLIRINKDQKVLRYTGTNTTKIRAVMQGGTLNE